MDYLRLVLVLVLLLSIAAALFVYWKSQRVTEEASYACRRPLKSYEQALYWRLVKTLPDHVILAQITMNRCVTIRGPHAATLAKESLDFVICNSAMRILAVIEIEDESRPITDQRQKIELLKEQALNVAGIKVVKCSPKSLLSEGYITMEFNSEPVTRLAA